MSFPIIAESTDVALRRVQRLSRVMRLFFALLERYGHAEIRADMEDYGREPGPIVTVDVGLDQRVTVMAPLEQAIRRAAREAKEWIDHEQPHTARGAGRPGGDVVPVVPRWGYRRVHPNQL